METIGHTPLIRLNKLTKDLPCTVLAKAEYFNPGNSIKDRMALKMVEVAELEGKLLPGGTIIECTSGNTGMGLALAAVVKGYKCIFTTTDKQSKEKIDILKALGAEVIVCPTNVEPEDPRSYYSIARRLAKEIPNSFHANQYDNPANRLAHYETTGPEIWQQTDGKVTHLVVATGTGGTVTGTAMFLKEKNPAIQVWAIDPFGSLLTKYFRTGEIDMNEVHPYISEGIGEDFVPKNYDMKFVDAFQQVTDKDAAVMARRIAREEGLFCGYSAGTAIQGLMQLKDLLKKDDLVVVILHDHGSRYVGKIYNDQWMMERGFMDVKTFKDIIAGRGAKRLITAAADQTVTEAFELMQKYHIENLPVLREGEVIGAISESGLFSRMMTGNGDLKGKTIGEVLEKPYPIVSFDTPLERLSSLINRENGAVLGKDDSGNYHIVTKYDIIQALGA
ncbi:MAG TPA: pyridoxal-phosphate dependent enzyme [Puia sp.]|nr:pyridoxal-phosphate dependent enzyme [Puia sp.]